MALTLTQDPYPFPVVPTEPPDVTGTLMLWLSDGRVYFQNEVPPNVAELDPFLFCYPSNPESGYLMTGEITIRAANGLLRYRIAGWRGSALVLELTEGEITGPPPDVAG